MSAKIRLWGGNLLVEYKDVNGQDCSFLLKTKKDIEELKKEFVAIVERDIQIEALEPVIKVEN